MQTSVITTSSGISFLSALTASCTAPFSSHADEPTGRRSFFPSRTKTGRTNCDGDRYVSRTRFRRAAVRRKRRGRYCGKLDTLTLVAEREVWIADEAPRGDCCLHGTGFRRRAPRRLIPVSAGRARGSHARCDGHSDPPAYH